MKDLVIQHLVIQYYENLYHSEVHRIIEYNERTSVNYERLDMFEIFKIKKKDSG